MKVCVILVCVFALWWRTEADSRTYLITAPRSLRLDAVETVLLQLFGFTDEVNVYVYLKTSMAPGSVVLAQEVVTLNAQNNHQATTTVRLHPNQVDKSTSHVILHVQSTEINQHVSVPVSRSNGFLFIQTDKPLYTPYQSVKVRAFSMNQELRPANRSVFLTFKDPDQTKVAIMEMFDLNNGIPSLQNPFKIPIKPKLGIWTIEASYSDDFATTATTDFEVKEYVLPSLSILVEPEMNFISYGQFNRFVFKLSARYQHGAPVAGGEAFLRFGYVQGKNPPEIIPGTLLRERLSGKGEASVTIDIENILSTFDGPKNLDGLVGKYFYIAVLLKEETGGIIQEAEFAAVKFVKSPYSLSPVSTPPFIKPGLPYNIRVLVKDHLDKPVNRIQVQMLERRVFREGGGDETLDCTNSATSQSDGLAIFVCNIPSGVRKALLKFKTVDSSLPAASQASLTIEALAYHSPNQRYLYIDPPQAGLEVGQYTNIKVYSAPHSSVPIGGISYLVLSRGKLVTFGSQKFRSSQQSLSFLVTPSMVPSIRLLVYYILFGEGKSELVADSVWLDVSHKCVNGLQTDLSYRRREYKPKDNLKLDIQTNQIGLVALSAVDSALFTLRPNFKDPVKMVLRNIEQSDQGCGGGGGIDSSDVFRLAGLTFLTNANAQPSSSNEACTALVRPRRALTVEERKQKVNSYTGFLRRCCEYGMDHVPKILTCEQYAKQKVPTRPLCIEAVKECCEFTKSKLVHDEYLILGRSVLGANFDLAPSLVRSYFPESWMWEVQPVSSRRLSITRPLPDTLTTWEIKAIGMFKDGMCVAEPVEVPVKLPLSVDVPLPYQVVRGEQVDLKGSVYNQQEHTIQYCVTLTAGPELCMTQSQPISTGASRHSTPCTWRRLSAEEVGTVTFTVLGLEPGEHSLTFTLRTKEGQSDILVKKLRVVPEGIRRESFSGGRLDPQGVYGTSKTIVELKAIVPTNVVPNSPVERMLSVSGEVLGDILSVIPQTESLQHLVNLPSGSAEAELGRLLSLVQIYQYLEVTGRWNVLEGDIQKNSADVTRRIGEGMVSISSFRKDDSSYSMWINKESSTWLTALVVKTLSVADRFVSVDHQSLSESVSWLIRSTQQSDGSFSDTSSYRPNRAMDERADAVERSVYLTSFVMIALHWVTSIRDPILQLRFHDNSMNSAANYISQHASGLKSVYVRAVATYALTLHDPNSFAVSTLLSSLENVARQKGNPAVLRYWQESNVAADWLKPDQSSGVTVETTVYALLSFLAKGRIHYANPILSWLIQDQNYGEGFYSIQDTVLTLEAVTEYSRLTPLAALDQDITIRFLRTDSSKRIHLTQSRPVATPSQVTKNELITVSTGYGTGITNVKLKTVYYEIPGSSDNCHFDLTIEVVSPDTSNDPTRTSPHLMACAKYKPPSNEVFTESTLTVMKIQLPTGVEAFLEDLRQFKDDNFISHYELKGNTVVIQVDAVPSSSYLCVGFRIRMGFSVKGIAESFFRVYEPQDKGSMCIKPFFYNEQKLQRLCMTDTCQCMTAACAAYRAKIDDTLTAVRRFHETCQSNFKYVFKVTVKSSAAEGDFMTHTATVDEVMWKTEFDALSVGTEVDLVKKVTCNAVDIQNNKQYLVMGSRGLEVMLDNGFKYRFPLDSEAVVELWPSECTSPECLAYLGHMEDFALELQLSSCQG